MISYSQWGNELYSGKRSYGFIKNRKIFFSIGAIFVAISLILIAIVGINPSIEFRGGSEFTVTHAKKVDQQLAYDVLKEVNVNDAATRVSQVGSDGIRVQTGKLNDKQTTDVHSKLAKAYGVQEKDVTSTYIGPSWGQDVTSKALWSLGIFLVLVSILMALYFRTWTMAVAALFALMHDVFLTAGFFALTQVEVSPATVIGFLTILGYSLYDTVVVFDKIRENTHEFLAQRKFTYGELVNLSVNQTLVRSINTSVVAILPVAAIFVIGSFLLGAGTLLDISLALLVGMIVGTLSSIFLASPLLLWLRERESKVKEHNKQVINSRKKVNEDGEEIITEVTVSPLQAGKHLGHASQPKKKAKSKR
ncbi:protein translocase subunit SecF [Actinomyces sp. zg-332]|uniref:protein translocase subunit SecF n=1 Tax=Actinomyces sp. zg-332 TaxID=2708340 RepID=UPI00141F8356|nr:protein translocase subunit SecF [Actinomyces sp. zg-332]QPK93662.1 protein translocase subunit SecF [Actinomyces sp. zg-332]